jgi:hypothetical protein
MQLSKVALSAERVLTLFVVVGLLMNCFFVRILKNGATEPAKEIKP